MIIMPLFFLYHVRQDYFRAEEGAVQVDGENQPPAAVRQLQERVLRGDAGVIDQHVDFAEFFQRFIDDVVDVVFDGDIAAEGKRFPAHRLDFSGGLRQLAVIGNAVADHEVGAGFRHAQGYRFAQSLPGAGDHSNFTF